MQKVISEQLLWLATIVVAYFCALAWHAAGIPQMEGPPNYTVFLGE